jgi:hypothetical protein
MSMMMSDYAVELLHPGWFPRRAYRTYAGIYATLERAQASIPYRGWVYREWCIGKYCYPMWECAPFGSKSNHAWFRVTPTVWKPRKIL